MTVIIGSKNDIGKSFWRVIVITTTLGDTLGEPKLTLNGFIVSIEPHFF